MRDQEKSDSLGAACNDCEDNFGQIFIKEKKKSQFHAFPLKIMWCHLQEKIKYNTGNCDSIG